MSPDGVEVQSAGVGIICDGTPHATNTIGFNSILNNTNTNRYYLPMNSTCVVPGTLLMTSARAGNNFDLDLNGANLLMTGDGGGACSQTAGGLIQLRGTGGEIMRIHNGRISANNPSARCLINFSYSSEYDHYSHNLKMDHLVLSGVVTSPNVPSPTKNLDAIWTYFSGSIHLDQIITGPYSFRHFLVSGNQTDIMSIQYGDFEPTSMGDPEILIDGAQGITISNNNFEATGVRITDTGGYGSTVTTLTDNWVSDGVCASAVFDIQAGTVTATGNFIYTAGCPSKTATAIKVTSGNAATLNGNQIFGFPYGITAVAPVQAIANNITASVAGITLAIRSRAEGNSLSGSGAGVVLNGGYNTVSKNSVYNMTSVICNSGGNTIIDQETSPTCVANNDIVTEGGLQSFVGPLSVAGGVSIRITTVAGLPACNSRTAGLSRAVSDARTPAYSVAVVGGGTVGIPVYCDGISWKAH